jgi:A/G-specific adenine glycosylase
MRPRVRIEDRLKKEFQERVIKFYFESGRRYPWRRSKDPFRILVAEILLRLTGAWKAEAVYRRVVGKFGNAEAMSKANVNELEEIIRPLGLLNRAKLLVDVSHDIVSRFDGQIPNDFTELMSLKGVGRYTANAVLCLGYGKKVPLVDESVKRVLTRCFHFESNKLAYLDDDLWAFAAELLPDERIKEYNLGLLDLGAMLCKYPKSSCCNCPLASLRNKKRSIAKARAVAKSRRLIER